MDWDEACGEVSAWPLEFVGPPRAHFDLLGKTYIYRTFVADFLEEGMPARVAAFFAEIAKRELALVWRVKPILKEGRVRARFVTIPEITSEEMAGIWDIAFPGGRMPCPLDSFGQITTETI